MNDKRRAALQLVRVATDWQAAVAEIEAETGVRPLVVATTAAAETHVPPSELVRRLGPDQPLLLLLGTGWGLCRELLAEVDAVASPIETGSGYNHLSVRSAAAILLDRFFGMRDEPPLPPAPADG